jgi:hypothetical protein
MLTACKTLALTAFLALPLAACLGVLTVTRAG